MPPLTPTALFQLQPYLQPLEFAVRMGFQQFANIRSSLPHRLSGRGASNLLADQLYGEISGQLRSANLAYKPIPYYGTVRFLIPDYLLRVKKLNSSNLRSSNSITQAALDFGNTTPTLFDGDQMHLNIGYTTNSSYSALTGIFLTCPRKGLDDTPHWFMQLNSFAGVAAMTTPTPYIPVRSISVKKSIDFGEGNAQVL